MKSQANDIYEEIGKKIYEKHVKEETVDIKKDLEEECTKLDVISDEIDSILKECIDLKDKKVCKNCYKEIDKNMNFCPECGAKQENEEEQKDDVKSVEVIETDGNKEEVENVEVTTNGVDNKIEIDETPGKADLAEEEKEQAQDNLELFYIMSRGLSYNEAVKLIVKARFNKILSRIADEDLRNEIIEEIEERLD